ncbi:SDR family oxidoreductase [Amycolatopsis cihanbeyliensis]|uniref:Nucleoside-diphosphate-sugar epimerase n=1 Tax=Amycolatopsis cihanbeyliensis TaxID=1128664 RepID=A0A542CTD5_AMYCI|nr:NAD(P)H-binding protein [Amycolatopsis cihanbeyliensis]TQI94085.1 nucleoside-diphosphate-sugar epimerase [Amycolatopsis cihanbeyliensis]
MTKQVLVTGGTGRLGRALVPRLLDTGHDVRVLTRRRREPAAHCWVVGDLRTGSGLAGAAAEADVIIHLATTNGRGDVASTGNLIEAAKAAGGPHLVYVSIVGIDYVALGYYRAKLACERLVEHSGLPWTILRATQFHDLIATMCDVQRLLPVTLMPSKVHFQPIDVTEVADQLVTLAAESAANRVPDIGGPEVREAAELARNYLRAIGRRRPVCAVPLPGKAIRDYRAGHHLTPNRAAGRITFDDFLAGDRAHGRSR